jgi:hypothetical protein
VRRLRRASDLAWVAHVDRVYLYPEQRRHSLNDGKLGGAGSYVGIAKDCRSRHVRRDLLEQLQPFSLSPSPASAIPAAGSGRETPASGFFLLFGTFFLDPTGGIGENIIVEELRAAAETPGAFLLIR